MSFRRQSTGDAPAGNWHISGQNAGNGEPLRPFPRLNLCHPGGPWEIDPSVDRFDPRWWTPGFANSCDHRFSPTDHQSRIPLPPISEVLESAGITLFERGWLSANNVLIRGDGPTALVDSGYCTHAEQTTALLQHTLGGQALDLLLNTHLHSDHCGGNAALQKLFPAVQTFIPPGEADAVRRWDVHALTYEATGQECPRFQYQHLLRSSDRIQLGSHVWDVHGASGHDPHAIVLHLASHRLLISADALWQNGFGVVFPELEGHAAFEDVSKTLDLIEALDPLTVIPGHGSAFQDVQPALLRARTRLKQFRDAPDKHLRHALKVLVKFKLLEWQHISFDDLLAWSHKTPYLAAHLPKEPEASVEWMKRLLVELERNNALRLDGPQVLNA